MKRVASESDCLTVECGIDEAGRGPVIGPMVISLVCGERSSLQSLGVKDSKVLSRKRREYLFDRIMEVAQKVEYRIVPAGEINRMMDRMTLNEVEHKFAAELASFSSGEVVVDCFDVNEGRASATLSTQSGTRVRCVHKADRDYPAVSAASIVSKVIRDREIDSIKERFGEIGSGYPADPVTREFIEKAFRRGDDIGEIIRTHWKTVDDIRRKARSGRLF